MDADLATLCQSCGLCCDGSLFGRVPLEPQEVEPARRNRLRIIESGRAFDQPCSVLEATADAMRACSIYDERPLACRRFVCRLHERHRREGGLLEPRLAAVRRVRELLAQVDRSTPTSASALELTQRIEDDFARA